jgi:RES domain
LMYRNRFFPDANINLDRLESLLEFLKLDEGELPEQWFRARIQVGDNPYGVDDMGAPPKKAASHGRANPAGIPYLYLGSNPTTAVSEIRPHTGEIAWILDFTIPADLKLVDLRQPRKTVSPFLLEDAEEVREMRGDIPFLERLGDELTRPVVPQAAAIEYTPSQYVCEFIKKCGYDGVVYRSSVVADGINLALFDPERATKGTVSQYRVNRVLVEAGAVDKPAN